MSEVLLVDDDADHRLLFGYFLTTAGHQVQTVANAQEALTVTRAHRFDVAVLDIRLRGEDGIELCRQLRRRPATADLPILMYSAEAHPARVHAALVAGADGFLAKPALRAELAAAVDTVLARRAGAREVAAHAAVFTTRAASPVELVQTEALVEYRPI